MKIKRILITKDKWPHYKKGQKLYVREMNVKYFTHQYHCVDDKTIGVHGSDCKVLSNPFSKLLCVLKTISISIDGESP